MLEIPSCLIMLLFTNLYYVKVTKDEDLDFLFKRFQSRGTHPALCHKFRIEHDYNPQWR